MAIVTECQTKPILSVRAREVMDTWAGGPIPEDIRIEFEQYIKQITPIIEQNAVRMQQHFNQMNLSG